MRVAILQLPAPEVFVPDGAQDEAWAATLERVDDAARDEPDLVVLPEAAYPAWFLPDAAATPPERTDAEVLATLSERARRHHITLAAGVVLGRPDAPENAAVLFAPTGEEIARAGEALPAAWFRRGRGPVAVDLGGVAGALAAGADLLDPRWVEAMAEAGTRVVISTGAPRGWPRDGAVAGDVA
ncbi:MAG: nitrilase-related carbon-nitrogen hydrolase, partial [Dehalococcoidia bacterium]